jgi:hypothetical protein
MNSIVTDPVHSPAFVPAVNVALQSQLAFAALKSSKAEEGPVGHLAFAVVSCNCTTSGLVIYAFKSIT